MKRKKSNIALNLILISVIFSIGFLPFFGVHLHLPQTHGGESSHSHEAQTHTFHLHQSTHDSIDSHDSEKSDSQHLELNSHCILGKVFNFFAIFYLLAMFLRLSRTKQIIREFTYHNPFIHFFEIYRAFKRGPPLL